MAVRLFLSGVKIRFKIRIIEFLILTPNKKESRSGIMRSKILVDRGPLLMIPLPSLFIAPRAKGDRLTAAKVVEIISGQPFLFLSYTINLLTVRSGVESGTTINPGNEIFIPEDHSLVTRRQISSTSTLPSRNM